MQDPLLAYSFFPDSSSIFLRHVHEVLLSLAFYTVCYQYVAPAVNKMVFGEKYTNIKDDGLKIDFDVHTVSMFQCVVTYISIYPTIFLNLPSDSVYNLGNFADERCSMVTAIAMGYFIWDLYLCVRHYDIYGFQFTLHASATMYVLCLTMRPFAQTWISKFLSFELSTPFVNINWYFMQILKNEKIGKSGVNAQGSKSATMSLLNTFNIVNGICLMVVFFFVRIIGGPIMLLGVLFDVLEGINELPVIHYTMLLSLMIAMETLSVFWFMKMIKVIRKLTNKK
ncbi:hypothetical protein TPHA_0I03020 [Tetrapisispora phaffii CBS 4417]|uniref:TLC domain-containing protein n=1 Tax=Tetrapisispora phaffii (strain ATCC 24235 / CBS 4417 / NBRC 1672 / NRRL Y-8282 / UCD 70-5) TaxID=1071381 RepID=G8BY25_TETPH|nr:hypothetical protein TPHA_0I03020 [Tetrapisispora phaffii CBS 4417]CCE64803.1 hypothetical protein TPHA_0I03020 [Tetrapisispora phaffii CBS 4417]